MFFGGRLYPLETASTDFADAAVALDNFEFDCAITGIKVIEATSAPKSRTFNTFRTDITFLRFDFQEETIDYTHRRGLDEFLPTNKGGQLII